MRVLALDLECVADADAGRRVFGLSGDDAEVRAAMRAKRLEDTDGRSDFHKPAFWQIVAVGLVGIDTSRGVVRIVADADAPERTILSGVNNWLEKRPKLLTWSGNGYDLAVLRYRALLHGISLQGLYGPSDQKSYDSYLYRYGEAHVDLMDALGGYGASAPLKLAELAGLCGLPAKTVADGSEVEGLVNAADWPTLKSYVEEDALILALLYLRWELTRSRLSPELFDETLGRVAAALRPEQVAVRVAIETWRNGLVDVPAAALA